MKKVYASEWGWTPQEMLKNLKSNIQDEKLSASISKSNDNPIQSTLSQISNWINPYLNWWLFIAWTAALILIMINWI